MGSEGDFSMTTLGSSEGIAMDSSAWEHAVR